MERVDLAAERAREPDLVDRLDAGVVHQQPDAGVERGLRELDRPDVVLGDDDPRPALGGAVVEDVRERPAVRHDPRRAGCQRPVDDAVRGDDAGEVELGDDLDDAAAADAGDAGRGGGLGEAGFVGPGLGADDPEPRLQRRAVDADALDRAGRRSLAAADLGALERGPRRRRCREQEVAVAEDDLGVRADVDDQLDDLAPVRRLGQDHARRVGPDVAGDAGQQVDAGAGMCGQFQLARPELHGAVRRQGERRRAERHRVDARARGDA